MATQPTNAGFEVAGASPGLADGWTTTESTAGPGGFSGDLYADFSGGLLDYALLVESFDAGWDTDPYVRVVSGGTVAFFDTTVALDPSVAETFLYWDGNNAYVTELSGGVAAEFGSPPLAYESFTDAGWGTVPYLTTLGGGDVTAGITESFESGWDNDVYVTEVSGGDPAEFRKPSGGVDIFEGFEYVAPDLLFTVPLPVNDECVTAAAHGKSNGYVITVITTGARPGGLVGNVPYYFVSASGATFKLALSFGGAAVDITDSGNGTHSIHADETKYWTVPLGVTF